MIDPMEAARIVERVMTEWGKQDSLRDMLDEITAEILALSPFPAVRDAPLREALDAAYTYITQPKRMTPDEATYDVRNYNALTAQIRSALGKKA